MNPPAITSNSCPEIDGYAIVEQLYIGSRTAVYRAMQTAQQRQVVIKVLRRDYPSFGELVQFRNQYTIAKNLPIPGIIEPLSLEPVGSSYALVMEDWGGVSLGTYIQQQSLNLIEVLTIALQIADVLHDLSQHGVVHKDIKPANILIHPESKQVKLIDFSIASLLPKETQEIQPPNILEGTLAYLAPEQTGRMNRGIDYRADFYALGVTLYKLLSGSLPFVSDDPLELMHCHIAKMPLPVNQVNPAVPASVAAIVAKLMAKNAEDRYQSALGLKHDLGQCLSQWRASGEIQAFELGTRDLSDRFLIPEKLYGRKPEVQTLLAAFDRVAEGSSELMLVAGFSGIGKTAIVNEVHKPITRQNGYFIKGKFDQFNRNIPLSAFVQALRDLMGQLFSESDQQVSQWQTKILTAVGENGQVLIDVIPELEQIIGKQPIASQLSGSAAQNRFNVLFQKFIEVFTTAAHPLVLFLDDLQWADLASLQLMKLLMHDNSYLLVLGAYRDNEVSPAHPFILTVEELKKAGTIVHTLTLSPLALEDTNHLIADTLNCTLELAHPLTELIDRKTQGNPFFTTQFLKVLHEDGQIYLDRDQRYWQCDIAQINSLSLTDDVVEFMAVQLQKLPPKTQLVIQFAACIGNQFDLATLAIVSEKSPTDTAMALWKALQESLLVPTSQVYKFFQSADSESLNGKNLANPVYRFLHDRIQQAAYSLIPEDHRAEIHYRIGRLLLAHFTAAAQEERIFEIVGHLNLGRDLIINPAERIDLARLNLIAGQKAKAATAYTSVVDYLTTGISLLPNNAWKYHYDLTLALHTGMAEAAYINTDFEQVEQWAMLVVHHAQTLLDTIPVQQTRLVRAKSQGQLLEAIQMGLQVLTSLGVEFPDSPTQADVGQAFGVTRQLWQDKAPLSLLDLPTMTVPDRLAAMQILSWLVSCAYLANPTLMALIIFKQVELSLQDGNCPVAIYGYADYGLILCGIMDDIPSGYDFGQLALELLDRSHAAPYKCRGWYVVYTYIHHWKAPLQDSLPRLQEAYQSGLETGDIESAGLSAAAYCYYAYHLGQELTSLADEIDTYRQAICQLKQTTPQHYLEIYQQTVFNLLGRTEAPDRLQGIVFNVEKSLPLLQAANHRTALFYLHFNQVVLSYLFGEYQQATQTSILAEQYLDGGIGTFMVPLYFFYDSLVQLALYQNETEEHQHQILERVLMQQEKLQKWSALAPFNHQHRWELVEAERYQVLGQRAEAIEYYDRAIDSARKNGFVQDEAIANELAAKFYIGWGKPRAAQDYLTHAYYGYAHWGAKAKVQDLEWRYSNLLAPILKQQHQTLSTMETMFALESFTISQSPGTHSSTSGSTNISATLDLATVLKASQALSSEIHLDKLLATLLHIVLESAGADRGVLLMPGEQQWFVEAVAKLHQPVRVESIALANSLDVPQGLIHNIKRSQEPVVIVNALTHPTLATDAYVVQHQPKSLLCTPILQRGKLVAILYLENNVTAGAFTTDRVELLNVLCAQAAISLENARLYQQAQTYAQQIEQSQLQIVQSEKMSSLGNLVAGVAHEINNPIGFLHGSIKNAKDSVQDLLRHLALYQHHYPHPVAPVQDNAENIDLEFLREDLPKLLISMNGATDRIKGISTSLRTFSRADTEHKVRANLHEGIDSTLMILKYRLKANEHHPEIKVLRQYGELPLIQCFPGQLNQVFMNILANAIDMFEEIAQQSSFIDLQSNLQTITIQTSLIDPNKIEIRIIDNGKGIFEEVKDRIFDHLFTTKEVGKGTGLGLAIARQIVVEKHGGSLDVKSAVGQGTEFCIRLPIYAKKGSSNE